MSWEDLCGYCKGYKDRGRCPGCQSEMEEIARILAIRDMQSQARGRAVLGLGRELKEAKRERDEARAELEDIRVRGVGLVLQEARRERDEARSRVEELEEHLELQGGFLLYTEQQRDEARTRIAELEAAVRSALHSHDDPETMTCLSPSVEAQFRRALNAAEGKKP